MSQELIFAGPRPRYFTSHQVGSILQVTTSSVIKWIDDGLLEAFRTPGGHRRVSAVELVRFARRHGLPLPDEMVSLAVSRLLVVDDDTRFLSAVKKALGPFADEFDVATAVDEFDALIEIGKKKPQVVLLDLRVPTLNDGIRVLERIQAREDLRDVAVVVLSGEMNDELAARCKSLGALATLQKPVKTADLVELFRGLRRDRRLGRT